MCNYTVFISACHGIDSQVDVSNTHHLNDKLNTAGFFHVQAEGVYDGKAEVSFSVQCDSLSDVLAVFWMARTYGQQCILVLDNVKGVFQFVTTCDRSVSFFEQVDICHLWKPGKLVAHADKPEGDYTRIGQIYYTLEVCVS